MAEEHILSKAFFYFVCLDIMLYSGKRSSETDKSLGFDAWVGVTAARAGAWRPLGLWLQRHRTGEGVPGVVG